MCGVEAVLVRPRQSTCVAEALALGMNAGIDDTHTRAHERSYDICNIQTT